MKKLLTAISVALALVLALGLLCSCQAEQNEWTKSSVTGQIGDFSLIAPVDNASSVTVPTFSWEAAQNASHYTLEVCSSTEFSVSDKVYIKKTGVTATSLSVGSSLKDKNATYYWRVTAFNESGGKLCGGDYDSFYLAADATEEIPFPIEYADEWTVHPEGSFATVGVDKTNFFGNGENSLSVSFVSEDTNRGVEDSDGWIVITKTQESEMYGVDAFWFNFYYSGQDADVFIRVVDEDNEYWHAQIKLANNAKQTVIMPFDQFLLRDKGGTTVANQVFDYSYVKAVEIVFERSFGDGVALISDIKAVSYEKYSHLFMTQTDFSAYSQEDYIYEAYNFATQVSDEGSAFTLSYTPALSGYGFVKLPVATHMTDGDAFAFRLRITGPATPTFLLRFVEEDGDRWVYKQSFSTLSEEYLSLVVPYAALTLSEAKGDGARQFYYLKQIQIGLEGAKSIEGSITVKDLRIVSLAEEIPDLYNTSVGRDGLIEDFENYLYAAQTYYKWEVSATNKDETIGIDTQSVFGANNTASGKFTYKSDMGFATYGIRLSTEYDFSALSFQVKDGSLKSTNSAFSYLQDVNPTLQVRIFLTTGEQYTYLLPAASAYWTQYVLPFGEFTLDPSFFGDAQPVTSQTIAGISFALQYYYKTQGGAAYPVYTNVNPVYFDNIAFTNDTVIKQNTLTKITMPDESDPDKTIVENYDGYENGDEMLDLWRIDATENPLSLTLAEGSMKIGYTGVDTSSCFITPVFHESVKGKGLSFALNGDGKADVNIDIIIFYAGNTFLFRYIITDAAEGWHDYAIGFSNFARIQGTGNTGLSSSMLTHITKIAIGVRGQSEEVGAVYLDDLTFDNTMRYNSLSVTATED